MSARAALTGVGPIFFLSRRGDHTAACLPLGPRTGPHHAASRWWPRHDFFSRTRSHPSSDGARARASRMGRLSVAASRLLYQLISHLVSIAAVALVGYLANALVGEGGLGGLGGLRGGSDGHARDGQGNGGRRTRGSVARRHRRVRGRQDGAPTERRAAAAARARLLRRADALAPPAARRPACGPSGDGEHPPRAGVRARAARTSPCRCTRPRSRASGGASRPSCFRRRIRLARTTLAPCIVFFDEIDGLGRRRTEQDQSCVYSFEVRAAAQHRRARQGRGRPRRRARVHQLPRAPRPGAASPLREHGRRAAAVARRAARHPGGPYAGRRRGRRPRRARPRRRRDAGTLGRRPRRAARRGLRAAAVAGLRERGGRPRDERRRRARAAHAALALADRGFPPTTTPLPRRRRRRAAADDGGGSECAGRGATAAGVITGVATDAGDAPGA